MIDRYEIKKVNNEEVLCLYFNFDSEFAKFNLIKKASKLTNIVKDFIKENKILFKGSTVAIISGGMFLTNVWLKQINNSFDIQESTQIVETIKDEVLENNKEDVVVDKIQEEKKDNIKNNVDNTKVINKKVNNKNVVNKSKVINKEKENKNIEEKKEIKTNEEVEKVIDNNIYVNIKLNGKIEKLELEEYVIGVVAAEMPAEFSLEALKAQSILARTYALKALSKNKLLTTNESTQSYKTKEELKKMWGSSYDKYYEKTKSAVNSTKNLSLKYKGEYIEAVYHSTSNGQTEDASNVWGNIFPYLISVDSSYDKTNKSFIKTINITYEEISKKLNNVVNKDSIINILGKTSGNRVSYIEIDNNKFSGVDFRNLLNLRSTDFEIEQLDESLKITTKGYGHGVGLSQYGANGMAKNGSNYKEILSHYYPNTTLSSL